MSTEIPTVVVTGFGPFRSHNKNSSWITILELLKLDIKDINIIAKEVPVEYNAVSKTVPQLWKDHKPQLVVHCGMSEQAKHLTIEKLAKNKHYHEEDVSGKLPLGNVCNNSGPDCIRTSLDVEKVVNAVNESSVTVSAEMSTDAGRYLCEFIYYSSLQICKRTAFVHIPPINQPYCARDLAEGLVVIIRSLLEQCSECDQ